MRRTPMPETTTVRPGQIWQSKDPRETPGIRIRVLDVDFRYAHVESASGGRPRRILLDTNSGGTFIRGYRLAEDVAS
jgi:hypothetical protein